MNIHEYQGKEVLKQYGVAVPKGQVAFTVDEAVKAAEELGSGVVVVKAQIHAGGRGRPVASRLRRIWMKCGHMPKKFSARYS